MAILALLLGGCGSEHDRAIDELTRLRDRRCDCPSLACANAMRAELAAWDRTVEPTLPRMSTEQRSTIEEIQRKRHACDGRFSM